LCTPLTWPGQWLIVKTVAAKAKRHIAFKVYRKALRAIVHPAVEELRKLEAERIADLRQRIWSRLAGRPDPNASTHAAHQSRHGLSGHRALLGDVAAIDRHRQPGHE
jgi:hypothetical protein